MGNSENSYRSATGQIRNLQKRGRFLYSVELWLLNDQVNRNGWRYTELEKNMSQFYGTPILVAYVDDGNQIGDRHNFSGGIDKATGKITASFTAATAERIVGSIGEDPGDVRIVEADGVLWVVARGTLWTWYARELVEKIDRDAQQGHNMSISIETLVKKEHMEGQVAVEDEYTILGTTILGDHVRPAVSGAHIAALASRENFNGLKMKAASYAVNSSDDTGEKPEDDNDEKGQPEQQEPEANKNKKGVKNNMEIFGKWQIDELSKKFPDFKVLAAGRDEAGTHICLMSKDNAVYEYTAEDGIESVIPEKMCHVNAVVSVPSGLTFDAASVVMEATSEKDKANSALDEAKAELEKANKTIETMREIENKRRVNAAKAAAKAQLDEINCNREEADKFSDDLISGVISDCDNGVYTDACDKDGRWIGDENAKSAVREKCMTAQMEQDKLNAEAKRNAAHKAYAFEVGFNGASAANDIQSMYESIMA